MKAGPALRVGPVPQGVVDLLVPGRRHDVRALRTSVAFADREETDNEHQEAHGGTSCRGGEELLPLRNLARLSEGILHEYMLLSSLPETAVSTARLTGYAPGIYLPLPEPIE